MSRFRGWIQAGATLLTNLHLPNFLKGGLYQGAGKTVCVPGLNCYSCPAASGACPIGAFQAVVGSSKFSFSYYITGFLILLGVLLGRFICGFLCPFGWFQELLHKIPTKKLSTKRLKPLTYLKYAVLLVMVFLLPAFLVNDVGMGDPFFCKYLCPQGVLEGAIPLSLANSGIRAALGKLFTWKFSILLLVIALSVLFYRPFCKWLCPAGTLEGGVPLLMGNEGLRQSIGGLFGWKLFVLLAVVLGSLWVYRPFCKYLCPLGAFYSLFNRVGLYRMAVKEEKCTHCGQCEKACGMGVKVTKNINALECIRCGECARRYWLRT